MVGNGRCRHLPSGGDAPARLQIPSPRLGPRHRTPRHAPIWTLRHPRALSAQPRRARRSAAMPIVNIDLAWLNKLLGKPYETETLRESLEQIGCDVEDVVEI